MANKTIYVSEKDVSLFDEAKDIAGEALSSVIVLALKEYVARNQEKSRGMKEFSVLIGKHGSEREKRFVGTLLGKWDGFSDDREWWLSANIYQTQKGNWAVLLTHNCKASLLTNKRKWKESGDYLVDPKNTELLVAKQISELKPQVPTELFTSLLGYAEKAEKPVEYLDI